MRTEVDCRKKKESKHELLSQTGFEPRTTSLLMSPTAWTNIHVRPGASCMVTVVSPPFAGCNAAAHVYPTTLPSLPSFLFLDSPHPICPSVPCYLDQRRGRDLGDTTNPLTVCLLRCSFSCLFCLTFHRLLGFHFLRFQCPYTVSAERWC